MVSLLLHQIGADSREIGSSLNLFSHCLIHYLALRIKKMQEGIIARLTDKGFGFIKCEGRDKDLFFHSNELVGITFSELREGDKVSFEIADSPKGPNAVKVSKVA